MTSFVELDGAHGEGGGQILRTGLFLSTLLGRPLRAARIRHGRPKPGLKAQHLGILQLLERLCGARVEGARLGAEEIRYEPGPLRPGYYAHDIGTAGSLTLFLQTIFPLALLAPGRMELDLTGGTDVPWSPTIDWFRHVYVPRVSPVAARVEVEVLRRGFHPAGGGRVRLRVEPDVDASGEASIQEHVAHRLGSASVAAGPMDEVIVHSVAHRSLEPARVAHRQADAARAVLLRPGSVQPRVEATYEAASSPGSAVTVWARDVHGNRWGGDALGRQGLRAEEVGRRAASQVLADATSGATVDRHLADHLAPWVALGMGAVRVPAVTAHLRTNLWACEAFLGADCVHLEGSVLRRYA